jgi:predicted nucleic acid-binding protein
MDNQIFYGRKITNERYEVVMYPKLPSKFKEEQRQYKLLTKRNKKERRDNRCSKQVKTFI